MVDLPAKQVWKINSIFEEREKTKGNNYDKGYGVVEGAFVPYPRLRLRSRQMARIVYLRNKKTYTYTLSLGGNVKRWSRVG